MRKLYVLNFNSGKVNTKSLHKAIESSELISNWSHYLPDSYIIQSKHSAKELSLALREEVGEQFLHYIFRLDKSYWGRMPTKQWSWLKNRADWWR